MNGVINTLRDTAGKSIIVVDEAQKLNPASLEVLREIFDETRVGIVMVGSDDFRERFKRKGADKFAHIASRITYRMPRIDAVPEADFRAVCVHYGVTDPDAIAALRPLKAGAGGLRHVVAVIEAVFRIADDDTKITAQLIKGIAKSMGIDQ